MKLCVRRRLRGDAISRRTIGVHTTRADERLSEGSRIRMVGVNAGHIGPRTACRLREAARARSPARISIIKKEHYLSSTYRHMLCNSFFKKQRY